jgi:hypothetical protein
VRSSATALFCLAASQAAADAVVVEFDAVNRTLAVPVPESAFSREGIELAVDLDGYDVTAFARIEDRWLLVEFDVDLAAGEHALALVAFHADGSEETLADAVFEIAATDRAEWALNTVLESNYRVQESSGDYAGADVLANSGSISVSSEGTRGKGGYGAVVEATYDEANASIPGTDEWLLPYYEFYAGRSGETASAWAVAGNIATDREDLLFSSYQRRGAALETSARAGRFTLRGFSVGSEPQGGFGGDYFFASDADDRSSGVTTSLVVAEKRLELGGAYIDGRSRFGGDGFNPQNELLVFGGETWNVSVDSSWLDDEFRIRFERAGSDFDADGIGSGAGATRGNAAAPVGRHHRCRPVRVLERRAAAF